MTLPAKWTKLLETETLQRSSQIVSAVGNQVYVFGGELRPREPRDNDVHVISLDTGKWCIWRGNQKSNRMTSATPTISSQSATATSPSPRVGTAASTLNGKIYLFSGRGGVAMAPIEERGSLWEFDPSKSTWTAISLADASSDVFPAARSYHCTASDGVDTIYIHAGCPEKGRLSDLWAFSLARREWTELASAPDPARGGTSIAFVDGKLYRMNGFDGKSEQGGCVDIYSPQTNSWNSFPFTADGKGGPTPRSVSVLLPVVKDGRTYLITLFGERDPSSLGHQGAGKMLGDVWAFDTASQTWSVIRVDGETPDPRGWFDADVVGQNTIVVHGGLGESNNRLGDVWKLELS
ncbi:hypothetical protein N7492_010201 [Penicillium capsulatum]|uniref:Kelch repeat protein n=1 Tax=Penicillium capsulatum TaxID=69766 RepID=A0A9W9HP73_9EURO|nr:hypothetical protein N7492_010201 [Penicillium capsulatum]KAJ6112709.1 hypothetical protein N7512_008033 [Penicillium capsulatum]